MQEHSRVHFIGVGGIGMSALARLLKYDGHTVSGSDRARSTLTETLEHEGIDVVYEQVAENITDDIDAVVYTLAMPSDHPELAAARDRGIPVYSYPEMLGEVSKDKYTIAVAGTHGKTTTTAMIAAILERSGLDPTVIVGSLMRPLQASGKEGRQNAGSNFRAGKSDYFVVEACEYKRSFLHLSPTLLVITNIDQDHLDYYTDLADIQSAFRALAERVPSSGAIICQSEDENTTSVLSGLEASIIDYASTATDGLELPLPGDHNQQNAQAALTVGEHLGVEVSEALAALKEFKGVWRRFENVGEHASGALLYDDYAHHPREISSAIAGFREMYPDRVLKVVFQPHLYSRTKQFLAGFADSLSEADELIIAPTYAAREAPTEGVDHHALAEEVARMPSSVPTRVYDSFRDIAEYINDTAESNDLIVTMGAGDINTLQEHLAGT